MEYNDVLHRVERGIEAAWLIFNYLDAALPLWKCQQRWHPSNEPPSTDDDIDATCGENLKINMGNRTSLRAQTKAFHMAWTAGRWKGFLNPEQPLPGGKGKLEMNLT